MKRRILGLGLCPLLLVSCGDQADSNPPPSASANQELVAALPDPPKPPAKYDLKEGNDYAYITAVSEEDAKAGKVAGDVLMFRYLGKEDGVHKVARLSDDGQILFTDTCAEPCVIIKMEGGKRIAYNPNSVIGSVFQDAINGYLDVSPARNATATGSSERKIASTIPSAFRGAWDENETSCEAGVSEFALRVSGSKLEFYESDAEVKSVRVLNSRAVAITATSAGEGQVWDSTMELVLSRSGNELTVRNAGSEFTRSRCA